MWISRSRAVRKAACERCRSARRRAGAGLRRSSRHGGVAIVLVLASPFHADLLVILVGDRRPAVALTEPARQPFVLGDFPVVDERVVGHDCAEEAFVEQCSLPVVEYECLGFVEPR